MNNADEESDLNEAVLHARLEYDSAINNSYNQAPIEPPRIDPDSAKTIRLLRDVLGPQNSPDSHSPLLKAPQEWELPEPFGRFEILEKLGQGSFGSVWKAYDPILKRLVAIKALHPELRLITKLQVRFENEAQATARLNHPNIVRLYEVGAEHGINYIVSEYVQGHPLRALLNSKRIQSQQRSASIIAQLADAMHHSHLMGVVHRDIKPENVILETPEPTQDETSEGTPRLTDFGLARLIDQQSPERHVSTTGLIVGSIDYMAPEQLMGDTACIGPSSDIYALGVLLFEMLTGHLPRNPSGNIFRAIEMSLTPQDPRSLNPDIQRDLAAICIKCLAFSIKDRFHCASELRDELNCFLSGKPTLTRPPTPTERFIRWSKSNRSLVSGIAMVLCSILLALGVSLSSAILLAKRNGDLILAKDAITAKEKETKNQESLYRNLAWMSALKVTYGKLEQGDLQGVATDLASIQKQHSDAISRPEWQVLNAELKSQYRLLHKESFPLKDVVAIPNTNLIAIAGNDPTIRIVDRTTQATIQQYVTSHHQIHALAVSSDGKRIAMGGAVKPGMDRTRPTLIDFSSGQITELNASGSTTIESLAFSPNSSKLAIGCRYEDILVIDLEDNEKQHIVLPASRRARALHWLSENELIVHKTAQELIVHNIKTSESKSIKFAKRVENFAVAKNEKWLIASNFDYDGCTLVSMNDTNQQIELNGVQRQALCVAVSPDEQWIAAGVETGDVSIWRMPKTKSNVIDVNSKFQTLPEIRRTLLGGGLNAINWCGDTLIAVGESGETIAWSPFAHKEPFLGDSPITAVTFLNPKQAALGFENGQVRIANTEQLENPLSGNLTHLPTPEIGLIQNLESSSLLYDLSFRHSKNLWAIYANGDIRALQPDNLATPRNFRTRHGILKTHSNSNFSTLDVSHDGKWLAVGDNDNQVLFYNQISDRKLAPLQLPSEIWEMRFLSPKLLCVTGIFEGARVYDIESGQLVASLGKAPSKAILFNSQRQTVSIGFRDGYVRTWSINSWELIDNLRTNDSLIVSICQTRDDSLGICVDERSNVIAFSPKGKLVLGKIRELNAIRNANFQAVQNCMLNADDSKLLIHMFYELNNKITSYVHIYDLKSP